MDIWQTVLEKPIESMASNFFALGGNSLLFVSLISQVEKQFKIQLPYKELSELLTLASMSEKIIQMTESPVMQTPQTTPHKVLGAEPLDPELYRQLLLVTAEWQGVKHHPMPL
ncbi:acyl carrier protein [Methylocucumis oryzae]|nr:acyl carrier protein [Methylocucumis oryzae]